MTVPIGIIIYFCVYKLSDTRHKESSSARYFSFVGHSQLSRVEFQRYIFLDPQRGYVTVYWLRIRVLSSPSEGRPLAAVIITTAGSRLFI